MIIKYQVASTCQGEGDKVVANNFVSEYLLLDTFIRLQLMLPMQQA